MAGNRSFLFFAVAMIGSYVLSFQVYLALPLHAANLAPQHASALIAAMFAVSGVVAVTAQLRITRWFSSRWGTSRSLVIGMTVVALSFVPLILFPDNRFGAAAAVGALLLSAAVLAIGSAAVFPFEMDTVVALAGGRLVGTHYGFYSTIVGVGILCGNLATGALVQAAGERGAGLLVWVALAGFGLLCAAALRALARNGHLQHGPDRPVVTAVR